MTMSTRLWLQALCISLALMQWAAGAQLDSRRQLSSSSNYRSSSRSSNRYQSYSQYGDSAKQSSYNTGYYNGARDFSVCDGSVVRVMELYILCDSPYTFYYGNGANRHSPVCNYGDKVSFEVRFRVTDDIQENEPIYVTMAMYDDQGHLLASTEPSNLCDDFVGSDCTLAGYYKFSSRMRLPYPTSDSVSDERFLPQMHMAFSTHADSGYNLGAMNIECEQWDEVTDGTTWLASKPQSSWIISVLVNYGLLVLSCIMLASLGSFLWRRAAEQKLAAAYGLSSGPSNFIGLE